MPRLSDKQYLHAHKKLKRFWNHADMVYGYITPTEQWQLHKYFQPSKDLTDQQLLDHRKQITKEQPSLPHQAGRALANLEVMAARWAVARQRQPATPAKRSRNTKRSIQVRAVVNPEPDLKRIAEILVEVAQEQIKREDADKAA